MVLAKEAPDAFEAIQVYSEKVILAQRFGASVLRLCLIPRGELLSSIRIGDTSNFPPYVSGGLVTEKKAPGVHTSADIFGLEFPNDLGDEVGVVPCPFKSLAETLKDQAVGRGLKRRVHRLLGSDGPSELLMVSGALSGFERAGRSNRPETLNPKH